MRRASQARAPPEETDGDDEEFEEVEEVEEIDDEQETEQDGDGTEIEEEEEEDEEETAAGSKPTNQAAGKRHSLPTQRPPLHPSKAKGVPKLPIGGAGAARQQTDKSEDEHDHYDEEDEEDGGEERGQRRGKETVGFDDDGGVFSQKVVDFLADEEPNMLAEGYAPFAEVADLMDLEADEEAFEEAYEGHKERQEEARTLIFEYVDAHYQHFNKSIAYFSQMAADVYDVEETLEILKNESAEVSECLMPEVAELRVFHDKALRAAMKARILADLDACVRNEHYVASLLQTRRHLTAVRALQQLTDALKGPTLSDLTCTQRLLRTAETLQTTLQRNIRANLHNSVFRRFRLQGALGDVVEEIVAYSGRGRNAGAVGVVERGLQDMVTVDVVNIQDDLDDPAPEQKYVTFIPMCVKALYIMDPRQLSRSEIIFGPPAVQRDLIVDFVARYMVFYVAWQGKCNRQSDSNALSVRATARVADRLSSVVTTVEEAVVKLQAPNVRAFLGVLLRELSKILRNAEFFVNALASMEFPFLQRELMGGIPIESSPLWSAAHATSFQEAHSSIGGVVPPLRSFLTHVVGKARVACAMLTTSTLEDRTVMAALWQKIDVNTFLMKWGVDPSSSAPEPLMMGGSSAMPSFGDFLDHVQDICDHMVSDAAPRVSEEAASRAALAVAQQIAIAVRDTCLRRVADIRVVWDIGTLWEYTNDAIISTINLLCAVQEGASLGGPGAAAGGDELISAGARERPSWVHSTREDHRKGLSDLLYYRSVIGGPAFVSEIGSVGFSLSATASVIWQNNRLSTAQNAMSSKKKDPIKSSASGLEQFLHLTRHNAIVVFGVVDEFVRAVQRRIPLLKNKISRALEHIRSFVVNSFAPALYGIHARRLRDKFLPYLPYITPPSNSLDPSPPVAEVGCQTAYDPSTDHPLLAAATYVHTVALKVKGLSRGLPKETADELVFKVVNPLTETLLTAARDSVTALGLGSFAYRVVHQPFVDAFNKPLEQEPRTWFVMRDENNIYGTQVATDARLFAYYEENNKERTSGYHASMNTVSADEHQKAQAALDAAAVDDLCSLEGVGKIPANCLRLRSQTAVVGLGLICHTFEWLGNALVALFWDTAAYGTHLADLTFAGAGDLDGLVGEGGFGSAGDSWAARGVALSQCCVPGFVFMQSFEKALVSSRDSGGGGASSRYPQVTSAVSRLALLYRQTMTISQAALFVLAIDARFVAFRYLPQIRDEPYTWLATPTAPDAVITQYNRAMLEMTGLLSASLGIGKRRYVALTIGSPVGKLLLSEMSLLRDKRITDSGQRRLQNNLLALQSTLQMLVPGDVDIARAVQEDLLKVNIFFNNLRNPDVVNTIVSSGDFKLFSKVEVMNLITLVFRSESSEKLAENVSSFQRRVHQIRAKKDAVKAVIDGAARQMIAEAQAAAAARAGLAAAKSATSSSDAKKAAGDLPDLESIPSKSSSSSSSSSGEFSDLGDLVDTTEGVQAAKHNKPTAGGGSASVAKSTGAAKHQSDDESSYEEVEEIEEVEETESDDDDDEPDPVRPSAPQSRSLPSKKSSPPARPPLQSAPSRDENTDDTEEEIEEVEEMEEEETGDHTESEEWVPE